jgi:eukaryotic translation initiation factor 2C
LLTDSLSGYNINLDPSLPLINIGTALKPIYFPAEFCTLNPGQPTTARLTASEATVMIDFACRSPYKNAKSLTSIGRGLLGFDGNPILENFGISVMKDLITVKARILTPPSVVYNDRKEVRAIGGQWNMRDVRVVKPGKRINTWIYININVPRQRFASPEDVKGAVRDFSSFITSNMGINMANAPPPEFLNGINIQTEEGSYEADLKRVFDRLRSENKIPDFALIIMPDKGTQLYSVIKSLADIQYGFHTVCCVRESLLKKNPQYYANVALKFNLKAGGVNHRLKEEHSIIKTGKTMVVGYDVTHPTNLGAGGKDGSGLPSQVGIVASIDRELGQWPSVSFNNPSRQEMLDDRLVDAFQSRLKLWKKHNANQMPDNIIIYRDGVSESQFMQVVDGENSELAKIRKACAPLYHGRASPRFSIIVSVKRHATRFYPTTSDPAYMDPKSRNNKAGTVVDRGVTVARHWDFFLQAHTALKGTARPAHYTVLLDEIFRSQHNANAANELEKLTHDMSYLFGRATKSVSIVPPAYYADIVCTRSRVHMADIYEASTVASRTSAGSGPQTIAAPPIHPNLADTMYYI